jgi:hypothetical protein
VAADLALAVALGLVAGACIAALGALVSPWLWLLVVPGVLAAAALGAAAPPLHRARHRA